MTRFDEVELETSPVAIELPAEDAGHTDAASRLRRLSALVTDVSFFAALSLALYPLLPAERSSVIPPVALAGFVLVVSFYYFCGCWLLWGKTVGGAIFDVRVVSASQQMTFRQASLRWIGVLLSIGFAGAGFLLAALPSRRSLPDLVSDTRCVASH